MAQTRTYDTIASQFLTSGQNFGSGALNVSNLNGVQLNSSSSHLADTYVLGIKLVNDNAIPTASNITKVSVAYTLNKAAFLATQPVPSAQVESDWLSGVVQDVDITGAIAKAGFSIKTVIFPSSPDGSPWTVDTLFSTVYELVNNDPNNTIRCSAIKVTVTFDLPDPIVTTGAALLVRRTNATLTGTINPSGATSTYPVTYYWKFGPTTAYGAGQTPSIAVSNAHPITGSDDVSVVGKTPNILTPNKLYHYILVGKNADGTVNGADATFRTELVDAQVMSF